MRRQPFLCRTVVLLAVVAAAGCDSLDLKSAVEVTDVSSGYYDNGISANGQNHLVPSVTFSVRNKTDRAVSSVDMIIMYWAAGDDSELDEALVKVIGGGGLPAGATSEPIVSRSRVGFLLAQPRAELFTHRSFREFTAKLFLKRGGKIVPAGEYQIEHRLLLADPTVPAAK